MLSSRLTKEGPASWVVSALSRTSGMDASGWLDWLGRGNSSSLGLVWLQVIPPGSPLFPRAREPRAELAPGDPPRHLDASVREVALPDPRRFHGKKSHDPRGRKGNPRLERYESTKIRRPVSSASELLRRRPKRRPWPAPSGAQDPSSPPAMATDRSRHPPPSLDLPSASKFCPPTANRDFYLLRSRLAPSSSRPLQPHIFSPVHASVTDELEPRSIRIFIFFLAAYELFRCSIPFWPYEL